MTVQLANELKGEGFTFIAMHPGTTGWPMSRRAISGLLKLQLPCTRREQFTGLRSVSCRVHSVFLMYTSKVPRQHASAQLLRHVMMCTPGVVATDMFHDFVNSGEGLADMFKPLAVRICALTLTLPLHPVRHLYRFSTIPPCTSVGGRVAVSSALTCVCRPCCPANMHFHGQRHAKR